MKQIIAAIVATALSATTLTAPAMAQPDREDYLKMILGAAVLAAIVNEAEKSRSKRKAKRVQEPEYVYDRPGKRKMHRKAKRHHKRHGKRWGHRHHRGGAWHYHH